MSDSIDYVYPSMWSDLWENYSNNIAEFMISIIIEEEEEDNYDADKMIEVMTVIDKLKIYSNDEQKELLTLIYNILKSKYGIIFMRENKEFALCAVRDAEEFMEKVCYSSTEIDTDLAMAIAEFFLKNRGVFCDHGFHDINYPLYEDIYRRRALKKENGDKK